MSETTDLPPASQVAPAPVAGEPVEAGSLPGPVVQASDEARDSLSGAGEPDHQEPVRDLLARLAVRCEAGSCDARHLDPWSYETTLDDLACLGWTLGPGGERRCPQHPWVPLLDGLDPQPSPEVLAILAEHDVEHALVAVLVATPLPARTVVTVGEPVTEAHHWPAVPDVPEGPYQPQHRWQPATLADRIRRLRPGGGERA